MAQTIVTKQPLNTARIATGTYLDTGTVAAYTFADLGFKPRYIRVINKTSGDEECWIEGMTAAHAVKRVAAGTSAGITSLGLTVSDRGFTFGLDTDMNVSGEQVYWVAIG